MSLYHVAITGFDRRSLTALAPKHRAVVVGYSENKKTGEVVVDAYINPRQEQRLKKHGYGVTRLEEVTGPDRQRKSEGRRDAAM